MHLQDRTRLGRYFPIKNLIIPLVERLVAHWVVTTRRWAPSLYLCSLSLKLEDFLLSTCLNLHGVQRGRTSCNTFSYLLRSSWCAGRRTSWTTWWWRLSSGKAYPLELMLAWEIATRANLESRSWSSRANLAAADSWMNVTLTAQFTASLPRRRNVTLHVMTSSLVDWRNRQCRDAMNTTYIWANLRLVHRMSW